MYKTGTVISKNWRDTWRRMWSEARSKRRWPMTISRHSVGRIESGDGGGMVMTRVVEESEGMDKDKDEDEESEVK